MGYFANLYVIEASAEEDGVTISTSVFGTGARKAYFSWGRDDLPGGMHGYGGDTIFCDRVLRLLPGYPSEERHGEGVPGEDRNRCLLEASLQPLAADDPVLFHFVLPEGFVPRRDLEPIEQPARPFVGRSNNRLIATYPTAGPDVPPENWTT